MRWITLLLLAACGPEATTKTLTDVGSLCLTGDGLVHVDFETCLSSSCDTVDAKTCSATLDGATLTVTASATVTSEGRECTADCGFLEVDCDGTVITDPSGLTVLYGGEETVLPSCDGV